MAESTDLRRFGEGLRTLGYLIEHRDQYGPLIRDLVDSLQASDERAEKAEAQVNALSGENVRLVVDVKQAQAQVADLLQQLQAIIAPTAVGGGIVAHLSAELKAAQAQVAALRETLCIALQLIRKHHYTPKPGEWPVACPICRRENLEEPELDIIHQTIEDVTPAAEAHDAKVREEGRQAGLEEAVVVVDAMQCQVTIYDDIVDTIRALKQPDPKEPTEQELRNAAVERTREEPQP